MARCLGGIDGTGATANAGARVDTNVDRINEDDDDDVVAVGLGVVDVTALVKSGAWQLSPYSSW